MPYYMVTVVDAVNNQTLRVEVIQADLAPTEEGRFTLASNEAVGAVTEVTTPAPGVNEHIDTEVERQVLWSHDA